jgi:hypothetical protein
MEIITWQTPNYEEWRQKMLAEGSDYVGDYLRPWHAKIDGPWKEDLNPEGQGFTEEEAKNNAILDLQETYAWIASFLRKVGAIPEAKVNQDLLKACQQLLTLSLPRDVSGERMVAEARAAVAKATGYTT